MSLTKVCFKCGIDCTAMWNGDWSKPACNLCYSKLNGTQDNVNHPKHYNSNPSGVECIQVARHMNFNLGNAIKYLWRAGSKGNIVEDLQKAIWYIDDEIKRITGITALAGTKAGDQVEAREVAISSPTAEDMFVRIANGGGAECARESGTAIGAKASYFTR